MDFKFQKSTKISCVGPWNHINSNLHLKKKRENELNALSGFESDENFAMILGYTSGGFPYGVTHEEIEEIKSENEIE